MYYKRTWVQIDLDAIAANIAAVEQKAGTSVMAVIKADAYGHGATQLARLLRDKCRFFGVATVEEALELRHAGIQNDILILGHIPVAAFPEIVRENIRPVIFTWEDALALSREALLQKKQAPFHFAIDTGMSRIGLQATPESADLCVKIAALPGLFAEGIFSHFATADCADLTRAQNQAALFGAFDTMLRDRGLRIPLRHLNNSAGVMNFSHHYEMVRSGIVTYGLYPSDEVSPTLLPLKPALSWYSQISYIQTLPAGRQISYGGDFTTTRETRVATISVGYGDGYHRSLSGHFHVLIRGKKAPILGRICMDQFMVDVTHIPDAQPEDTVTLVGRDGNETITVEEIAAAAGSFHYEFVCGISRRVPRVYWKDGSISHCLNYLLPDTN